MWNFSAIPHGGEVAALPLNGNFLFPLSDYPFRLVAWRPAANLEGPKQRATANRNPENLPRAVLTPNI